jgi:hypothetical protein
MKTICTPANAARRRRITPARAATYCSSFVPPEMLRGTEV